MKKKLLALALCFAMMLSVLPIGVFAAESEGGTNIDRAPVYVPYIMRGWSDGEVSSSEAICLVDAVIDESTTTLEDGKWYAVRSDVTNNNRIYVNGTANLILCDDYTLTANAGIQVAKDMTLNIYGQSSNSGRLIAEAGRYGAAGIGGNLDRYSAGTVNIYGGEVKATGGHYGAGIGGGGDLGKGGTVNVYGGTLSATGGNYGAGIGGSHNGDGGTVNIYSGEVNATGGYYGAGIGSGSGYCDSGTVSIHGGKVNAIGGESASGIGGGYQGRGGNVSIDGGYVSAVGGSYNYDVAGTCRAIGAGYAGSSDGTINEGGGLLKAGNSAADTEVSLTEYVNAGYKYLTIDATPLVEGENWYIGHGGTLYITGPVTNTSTTTDYTPWKEYKEQIKAVIAKDGAKVTNCDRLFSNCASLVSVDIAKLDITGTTNMRYMFSGCPALESLDLSALDTSAVTSMMCMFYNASGLKTLNLDGWNTEKVRDMQYMFNNCASLTELDLSNFDTSKVTTMYTTFYKCSSLEKLNISGFSGENLSNIDFVLDSCPALREIVVNGSILQKLAESLCRLSSVWYNKEIDRKYTTADELKALSGKIILTNKEPVFVPYIERRFDSGVVENEKVCRNYIEVDENTIFLKDGEWYVVNSDVTVDKTIIVDGNANLILCDGCTLNATKGIFVLGESKFGIYGQSADSGKLIATGTRLDFSHLSDQVLQDEVFTAGITVDGGFYYIKGSEYVSGGDQLLHYAELNIYGGTIEAAGNVGSAGIGGYKYVDYGIDYSRLCFDENGDFIYRDDSSFGADELHPVHMIRGYGPINIYGGNITADGYAGGAGIGGCNANEGRRPIKIFGGKINATGHRGFVFGFDLAAAGIGGGANVFGGSSQGGDVYIYGGDITAHSEEALQGIGGGVRRDDTEDRVAVLTDTSYIYEGSYGPEEELTREQYLKESWWDKCYVHLIAADTNIAQGDGWYIGADGTLRILRTIQNTDGACPWEAYKAQIKAIEIEKNGGTAYNYRSFFEGIENVTEIDCSKLKFWFFDIDNQAIDIIDCSRMFKDCTKLQTVSFQDVYVNDAHKVETFAEMFSGCENLTSLDLSKIRSSGSTDFSKMFYNCKSLETLDLSKEFYVAEDANTEGMFDGCDKLNEIKLDQDVVGGIADELMKLSPVWYNKETGEAYKTAAELKAIEGTVTLVQSVPFLFNSVSLVLSGELGLNFYTVVNDVDAVKDGYMLFEIGNKGETQTVNFSDAILCEDGRYVFRCNVNALQMSDTITVSFHYGDTVIGPRTITVAGYIDKVIAKHNGDDSDPTVMLAKSIVNYGHYAQLAQEETRSFVLGEDYTVTNNLSDVSIANIDDLEQFKATKTGSVDGITKVTRSLSLDHGTDINLYFTVTGDYVPNVTVTDKDGKSVDFTLEKQGGRYLLVIPQIAAHKLGDMYTVTVDGAMTINVSALSYAYSVLSSEKSAAQKLTVSALYEYYKAAKRIKGPEIGLSYAESGDGYIVDGIGGLTEESVIVIPSEYNGKPVIGIGDSAFRNCRNITDIVLPEGIEFIENFAFNGCTGLANINTPDSVTSVGENAFKGCPCAATENGVEYVGSWVVGADGVSGNVTLKDGTKLIGASAFRTCFDLQSITLPDGVLIIGAYAFDSCVSLDHITLPDSVTTIGSHAFVSCDSLYHISLSDNLTTIGEYAFESCCGLSFITISNNITSVGENVFYGCPLDIQITFLGTAEEWETIIGLSEDWGTDFSDCMVFDGDGNWINIPNSAQ